MLPAEAADGRRLAVFALRSLTLIATAALATGAAGCGDLGGNTANDEPLASGDTDVTVTLDPDGADGKEEPQVKDLSCDEDTTSDACAAANDIDPDSLAPADPATACTELFGGPDEAKITGSLMGEDIDVTLTRSNGCEIDRFEAAVPMLQALFPGYEPGASIGA